LVTGCSSSIGVSANKDKELEDPKGYTLIEYAYALMAKDAGIDMSAAGSSRRAPQPLHDAALRSGK